jgi:hypothetical protein
MLLGVQLASAALHFIAVTLCNLVLTDVPPTTSSSSSSGSGVAARTPRAHQYATAANGFLIKLEASVLDEWYE